MVKRKTLVRWQDGSYDKHIEKCEGCPDDHYEAGEDHYKEITSNQGYHEWLMGQRTSMDNPDNAEDLYEPKRANPDSLTAGEDEFWAGGEAYPPVMLARLEAAVASLTEQQRAVWELVYVKGKPHEEAATLLGIGQPAVSRCAARAMDRVKEYMGVNKKRKGTK